jgi:hypothetical protein
VPAAPNHLIDLRGGHFYNTVKTFPNEYCAAESGLPDGLFSNQKIPIWVNFGVP